MRRPAIRAVLFDWDGTIVNSFHADSTAYKMMFAELGIAVADDVLLKHYSPDWHRVYAAAGVPRERWDEADRIWRLHYRAQRPQLMPGARAVLRQLARRYVLGVVTSGNRVRVARQFREFGFASTFAVRVCNEDAPRRKPHPAPMQTALRRLRLAAAECIYVGDAPEDVWMARAIGVRTIGILGPFPTHARLRAVKPLAVLASIRALPAFLERL
jgi:phosphoglycolate phosphatase